MERDTYCSIERAHPLARCDRSFALPPLSHFTVYSIDPHLTSLNSTFVGSNPTMEVDGRPLIDFKQFSDLAEQVDLIVQYTPPRIERATRQDVLAYIEYSLKLIASVDTPHDSTEALSAKLALEERKMVETRARMRSLGLPWSPPRRK